MRVVPKPYSLLSVFPMTDCVLSMCVSVVFSSVLQVEGLRCWNTASVEVFQFQLANCSLRNMVLCANHGMNGWR